MFLDDVKHKVSGLFHHHDAKRCASASGFAVCLCPRVPFACVSLVERATGCLSHCCLLRVRPLLLTVAARSNCAPVVCLRHISTLYTILCPACGSAASPPNPVAAAAAEDPSGGATRCSTGGAARATCKYLRRTTLRTVRHSLTLIPSLRFFPLVAAPFCVWKCPVNPVWFSERDLRERLCCATGS